MSVPYRLVNLSHIMVVIIAITMVVIPVMLAILWWQFDWIAQSVSRLGTFIIYPERVGPGTRLLGFLISMIPASLLLYGLWHLREAFERFGRGEFFTPETIACIRTFALMLALQALARPIATALLSVVLTIPNPPGERALAISIGSGELEILFVGAVFFAIAHLMAEGRRLADDNAQIV